MLINLFNSGKSAYELEEEFDVDPSTIRRWYREYKELNEAVFSARGTSNLTPEEKEITRLKKKIAEAKLETEILIKDISSFSKKDGTNSSL